jgi:hypothetical protein
MLERRIEKRGMRNSDDGDRNHSRASVNFSWRQVSSPPLRTQSNRFPISPACPLLCICMRA